MTTKTSRAFSDMAIPPGEVLAEELEARGMTQKEFAARLGCTGDKRDYQGKKGPYLGYCNRAGEGTRD